MTDKQRLEVAAAKARKELRALALKDDATAAQIAEATAKVDDLEARAAALPDDPDPDPEPNKGEGDGATGDGDDAETREVRKLRGKAKVGHYLAAALTGRPVTGESAEYAAAVGLDGRLPLDLLEAPEQREARAVTPGPADETVTSTRPTVPYAFRRTDAAALGVSMPMVSPGEAHFPALTTAPPGGMKAKDAAAAATAAAFSLTKRTPGRITGQFVIRLEDIALFPSMETDLRRAIGGALANALDDQVLTGDGSSPNLSGLFHQATDVNAAANAETFATGVSRVAALVDGRHANGWGDIRLLLGVDTFEHYAGLFQSNGDTSLFDYLAGKVGGVRVSARAPAKASNAQKGLAVLSAQGQTVTVPVWSGVELIVDPYTKAAEGQRVVTAVSLVGSPFIPYGTSQVVEIHPKLA